MKLSNVQNLCDSLENTLLLRIKGPVAVAKQIEVPPITKTSRRGDRVYFSPVQKLGTLRMEHMTFKD